LRKRIDLTVCLGSIDGGNGGTVALARFDAANCGLAQGNVFGLQAHGTGALEGAALDARGLTER